MSGLSQSHARASLIEAGRILLPLLHARVSSFVYVASPCLRDPLFNRKQERDDLRRKPTKPPLEADCRSVYEDCLSDYPGFLADLQVLEADERSNTRPLRCIRRSEFYETESGIAIFDRTGYANYCLSRWLDKQREEARTPRKLVFEDPVLLPWPSRTLSPPPSSSPSDVARPMPPLPSLVCRPPRSRTLHMWKHIEDELQNALVVLIIGLFIHICLFLFLLYDILRRGLIPSDD